MTLNSSMPPYMSLQGSTLKSVNLSLLTSESDARAPHTRTPRLTLLLVSVCLAFSLYAPAVDQPQNSPTADTTLYLKVQPNQPQHMSKLRPGDAVQGKLLQDAYLGDRKVLPAGSSIQLIVDSLERRRRVPNDHWPWLIKFFTPRHEKSPLFRSATAVLPNGSTIPLQVSFVSIANEVEARSKRDKATKPAPRLTITLAASEIGAEPPPAANSSPTALIAGSEAHVILLDSVSASHSHPGDVVHARLVEPVWSGTQLVFPEGAVLEGKVVRRTPPRTLSRAGSLHVEFTNVSLPGAATNHIAASVSAAQVDRSSHMKIDPEGTMSGARPGKLWMLANIGATAGIAKEVDDATQLLVEAIISTATDASTAGTARIAATCISGVFMLTRHGRDVVLPKFAELTVTFDRPAPAVATR